MKAPRDTKRVRAESAGSKVSLIRNPVNNMVYINSELTLEPIEMTNLNQSGTNGDNRYSFLRYQYKEAWSQFWPQTQGFNVTSRFLEMHERFREFAVTGMKIEITPANREAVPNADPS